MVVFDPEPVIGSGSLFFVHWYSKSKHYDSPRGTDICHDVRRVILTRKTRSMSATETENEKTVKAPSKTKTKATKPSGYSFTEETTTVSVSGITDAEGKRLEKCLKGQIDASNDHQLRSAIRAHLGRMGVSYGDVVIDRG